MNPPLLLAHSRPRYSSGRPASEVSRKSYSLADAQRPGVRRLAAPSTNGYVTYGGENHLLTVAPTGAGKGRSVIIPTLLSYEGPVIVFDPKGENYRVTSQHRRTMGHQIVRIDPFNIADNSASDSFNPFDLMTFPSENISDESKVLTDLLSVEQYNGTDPFWRIMSHSLMAAILMYLGGKQTRYPRDITSARKMLFSPDFDYLIQEILGEELSDEIRQEFEQYMSITDVTRSGILATAKQTMTLFGVEAIKSAFQVTSFDIESIWRGDRVSVYIILPPNKIAAYRQVLRVWLGSFMSLLSTRRKIPAERTLFLVDEAGQLGHLHLLEQAITLLRGYGIQMWTFWQDLSQIKLHYGEAYHTIVSNCDVLEFFAMRNHHAEKEVCDLLGIDIEEVKSLGHGEMIVVGSERNPVRAFKLDYLNDEEFNGKFSANPYY